MVNLMRKYYIFSIQPKVYKNYQKKGSSLFLLLLKLKKSKKEDFKTSLILYHQICEVFELERFYNYFIKKFKMAKKKHYVFLKNKLVLELNYSCLVFLSEKQFPYLFRIFSYYSSYLFICDFENGDYFWLNEILEKKIE